MGKAPVDIIKYIIHAKAEAKGLVEKPDLIGAIFGQTEGLLGEDLDLRELQKSGRIGRIDADMETKSGVTKAVITVPSSLDMVETSIIAAGIETITRVGPCDATFKVQQIEDIREAKRKAVINRAREILTELLNQEIPDAKEITDEVRKDVRGGEIGKVLGLDAGPAVESSESIILVEGRADVLNLLRNGIKNAIAVGGIKVPKEAIELCNTKTSTVFVDGDRGGDLIIKSLENGGAEIDYIAKAPRGREVENLTRKEIIMALRRKVAADQAIAEMNKDGKRETTTTERKFEKRGPAPEKEEKSNSTEGKLLEMLGSIKNEALLLDKNLEEIKKLDLKALKKEGAGDAHALVIDDIISQEILNIAEKCKYLAGITTANSLNVPDDKVVVTKF